MNKLMISYSKAIEILKKGDDVVYVEGYSFSEVYEDNDYPIEEVEELEDIFEDDEEAFELFILKPKEDILLKKLETMQSEFNRLVWLIQNSTKPIHFEKLKQMVKPIYVVENLKKD